MPLYKKVAIKHVTTCYTSECGTIVRECTNCTHQTFSYKPCGSRYCNQCGNLRKSLWVEDRLSECLPIQYCLLTFTLPHYLIPIIKYNEKLFYNLFFKATAGALNKVLQSYYNEELQIGFMSALHTWDQELKDHPHIHILMPTGAISEDGMEWVKFKKNYLLPGKMIRELFRSILIDNLVKHFDNGNITIPENMKEITTSAQFRYFCRGEYKLWNVHIEMGKGKAENAIDYLGRYVNKTGISDERIENWNEKEVTLRVKNRKSGAMSSVNIKKEDFVKRFLSHILPKGVSRLRYFGFMSCRLKTKSLELISDIFNQLDIPVSEERLLKSLDIIFKQIEVQRGPICPCCLKGNMKMKRILDGFIGDVKAAIYSPHPTQNN